MERVGVGLRQSHHRRQEFTLGILAPLGHTGGLRYLCLRSPGATAANPAAAASDTAGQGLVHRPAQVPLQGDLEELESPEVLAAPEGRKTCRRQGWVPCTSTPKGQDV